MRNAKSRINTAFFVAKIKYLLKVYGKIELARNITFYNKDFLNAHPDIVIEKKSDSPDEDKSLADSKALLPVLIDFFQKHPLINPKTFLGDAAFDTIEIYKSLLGDIGFEKAFIPLRVKLSMEDDG